MLAVLSLRLFILQYWGKIFLYTLPNVLWNMKSATLAGGSQQYFWACVNSEQRHN